MFYLLNVAIGNSPAYIYSLTPFTFLEHQTSGFYHTSEANISLGYTLLVSLPFFSAKYLTGHRYFNHET